MTTFTSEDRINAEYEALPMTTIEAPDGSPYLSVVDAGTTIRIQLHRYDKDYPRGIYFNFDKKALPDLIRALEKYEQY